VSYIVLAVLSVALIRLAIAYVYPSQAGTSEPCGQLAVLIDR
jgi:hypothetical protein